MSRQSSVAIIAGIPPVSLAQLSNKGVSSAILPRLFSMLGKDKFHFSGPPIGPTTIASYLRQNNIDTMIFDYYFDSLQVQDCDIIGISSTFTEPEDIKKIVLDVRRQNALAPIILGGPLSWVMSPLKILEMVPEIDYIVLKEGEETFLQLIQTIRNHQNSLNIEGILYRDKESQTIKITAPRKQVDFEKLPYPAWDLMKLPSPKRLPVLFIETSRGCPYQCNYCSEVTFWDKPVRYRSEQRVTDEIRHNFEQFGISTFRFTDSCFSAPSNRCEKICDSITERCVNDGIPVKWSAYSRIENLSPKLMNKMKRSGCVALDVGLESGSNEVLRRMNKKYDPEIAVGVAHQAKEAGIIINYNIMLGFPGETPGTIQESMDLIERAGPDTFSCYVFLLRPNSEIYDHQSDFGIQGDEITWKHATLSSDEAKLAQIKFTREITSSTPFPGGEHFACYFSSLGYSTDQIRKLYRAVRKIKHNPLDIPALLLLKGAIQKIASFS